MPEDECSSEPAGREKLRYNQFVAGMKQLRDVLALIPEEGGIYRTSKAAKSIETDSRTVLRRIDLIEEIVGRKLFDRVTGHGLVLNATGRQSLGGIKRRLLTVLRHLDELGNLPEHFPISIGTVASAGTFFMPFVMERLWKVPHVYGIEIVTAPATSLLAYLDQGVIDMAIGPHEETELDRGPYVYHELFGSTRKALIFNRGVSQNSPLLEFEQEPERFTFSELKGQVLFLISRSIRQDLYDGMMRHLYRDRVALKDVVVLDSYTSIASMVRSGKGVGLGHVDMGADADETIGAIDLWRSTATVPSDGEEDDGEEPAVDGALRKALMEGNKFFLVTRKCHKNYKQPAAFTALEACITDVAKSFRKKREDLQGASATPRTGRAARTTRRANTGRARR